MEQAGPDGRVLGHSAWRLVWWSDAESRQNASVNTGGNKAASLALNKSSLDFGSIQVGSSKSSTLTLTNSSAADGPNVTFSEVTTTGAGFTASTPALPIVLAPDSLRPSPSRFTNDTGGREWHLVHRRGWSNQSGERAADGHRPGSGRARGFAFYAQFWDSRSRQQLKQGRNFVGRDFRCDGD